MKKFLSLAIAAIVTLGFSMTAANTSHSATQDSKQEKKEMKGQKVRKNHQSKFNPFEGLNLTEQQQEALKALRTAKCEKKEQPEGQCSARLTPEQRKQNAQEMLGKIKGILSPEQYGQYLENIAVGQLMKGKAPKHKGNAKEGRKGGKKEGRKGHRGQQVQQPQAQQELK